MVFKKVRDAKVTTNPSTGKFILEPGKRRKNGHNSAGFVKPSFL
jgi:hypothetical protein